jgi:cytochrome c oxidase subunit II
MLNLLAQAQNKLPPVAPGPGSTWMPPEASTAAVNADAAFYFIYWVSAFFFVLIVCLMLLFVLRYRQRVAGAPATGTVNHHNMLELTWSGIPLILVVVMFYMGFRGFMNLSQAPANAMDVRVLGQKWSWAFTYPNGHVDTELHVPLDVPVRLILESQDVIHSFFIPAFRIKRDAVPGRYNKIWFQATQTGEYLALCAEYCGTGHSDMLARVVVHEPGQFEKWMAEAADPFRTKTPAQVGADIVVRRCATCHSIDGRAGTGPTFKGIYEQNVKLKDGTTVLIDDDYIRESVLYPQAKIVAGFEPVMPTFRGQLSDRQITAVIEYIQELSGKARPATTAPTSATSQQVAP